MPDLLALTIVLLACWLLGWLTIRQFKTPFAGDWLEYIIASLTLGLGIMGWIAFILAEAGLFAALTLMAIWFLLVIGLGVSTVIRRLKSPVLSPLSSPSLSSLALPWPLANYSLPGWLPTTILIFWLPVGAWLFLRPHEYILGGADAGVYTNIGVNIAETGQILVDDPTLAQLDEALYPALLRPLTSPNEAAPYYLFPGFYVPDEPATGLTPQFYHLHSTWQAILYTAAGRGTEGVLTALAFNGIWAFLGTIAIFLTVRRATNGWVALLALLALSVNALQVWFARYPTTEVITQFFLWAGLWSFTVWIEGIRQDEKQPLFAFLSALALGSTLLIHLTMYFVLALPAAAYIWLAVSRQPAASRQRPAASRPLSSLLYPLPSTHAWHFVPIILLTLHSLIHAFWQSAPYFLKTYGYGFVLLERYWYGAAAALPVGLIITWGLWRNRRQYSEKISEYRRPALLAGIVLIALWGIYGWFIRPQIGVIGSWQDWYGGGDIPRLDAINFIRLSWYLAPTGIALGLMGMGWLLWKIDSRTSAFFSIGLFSALLYLWRIQASQHQIYTMRRYIPAVMPFFVIAAAYLLITLYQQKQHWLPWVSLVLTAVWLGGIALAARGFITQVDHAGLTAQIVRFSQQIEPHAILIYNDTAPIGQGDIIGTPLRFLHGHDVFTLRDPAALDATRFETQLRNWQRQGRALYWVAVPGGHEWPLSTNYLQPGHSFIIETTALEGTYVTRPNALQTMRWMGELVPIYVE